jgi:hypothetical protein
MHDYPLEAPFCTESYSSRRAIAMQDAECYEIPRVAMRYHEYRLQKGALVDVAGKQAATKKGGETCAGAGWKGIE